MHPLQISPEAEKAGLRAGSKKCRVYEAVKAALQDKVTLSVDELLAVCRPLGFFRSVDTPRSNLANILSQLKTKKLLWSDHRGNWGLRPAETAESAPTLAIVRMMIENMCPVCRRKTMDHLLAFYREHHDDLTASLQRLAADRELLSSIDVELAKHGIHPD